MIVAAAAFSLSACMSNSSYIVQAANTSNYSATAVQLVYDDATVQVEQEKVELLNGYLAEAMFENDKSNFVPGEGLTVKYGFVGYDEGSQAARYFAGGLAGGAKMVIVAEFLDAEGNSLSKIQSEGSVAGGFFGGDSDSAIKGAAKQIAKYARENFGTAGE